MSTRSKLVGVGLPAAGLTALAAGVALVVLDRPVTLPESPPRPPSVAPLGSRSLPGGAFIGAVGLSEPLGEAIRVASQRAAVVEAVEVEVGAVVSAGQVLLRLDPRAARAELALRRAQRDTAEAQLRALAAQVGPRRAAVAAAVAAIAAARARVRAAEADVADRRYLLQLGRRLVASGAIQPEEVERRQFAVDLADAGRVEAEAAVAGAEAEGLRAREELARLVVGEADARAAEADPQAGERPRDDDRHDGPELAVARRQLAQAAASVAAAETELELLLVRAPIAGRVLQLNVRPGELAPAAVLTDALVVLGRRGTWLRVQVDEVDIARFGQDARAWAAPRGDARRVLALRLDHVEPLVRPKRNLSGSTQELVDTRVLEVLYRLEDDADVALGQQFDVYIEAAASPGGA